ncbi:sulfotransferase [Rhodovulum sp. YNF3179]|uniref:sulfotransferase n=1 Tax=Rhodovulum sp. YNF3179 TaxID=3425127 RepID=UPI003D32BE08
MGLPAFLLIGAMKAGTTTLYHDLRRVPGLWLPPEKEPGDLLDPAVETPEGRARYAAKFAAAPAGCRPGEATTAYAKRPDHEGVAHRAVRVLGPRLRVIYLVRDPVDRITSQFRHAASLGDETRPPDIAVRADPSYLAYSRYGWQIEPWLARLGPAQVLVLSFEVYAARRQAGLDRVCAFLGVDAVPAGALPANASACRRVTRPGSVLRRVARSRSYLYRVKPRLPPRLHAALKAVALPRAPAAVARAGLAPATAAALRAALADDALAVRAGERAGALRRGMSVPAEIALPDGIAPP